MPVKEHESGGGFQISFAAVLALLTVAGSLLLVTQQLSSKRPLAVADGAREGKGEQKVEARLWEDPFQAWMKLERASQENSTTLPALDVLKSQIEWRSKPPEGNVADSNGVPPRILAVMVPGGAFTEHRESRIRSRFAVVSALGQAAYAPVDEDHVGAVRLKWPRGPGLNALARDLDYQLKVTSPLRACLKNRTRRLFVCTFSPVSGRNSAWRVTLAA